MPLTNLPDRSYETTKLLRRSKGVFSKARRTLTSPPKFRITRLSGPEGFLTTALLERKLEDRTFYGNHPGTVIPAHNWINRNPGFVKSICFDWKPSLLFYKGTESCNRKINGDKRFLPGCRKFAGPIYRYISDRRPRGLSLQQLAVVLHRIPKRHTITLLRILNGPAGYRTDSEGSIKSPGHYYRIRNQMCKTVCNKDAVIPDICLERRSISTVVMYCKD
jgi:hypothetical protein